MDPTNNHDNDNGQRRRHASDDNNNNAHARRFVPAVPENGGAAVTLACGHPFSKSKTEFALNLRGTQRGRLLTSRIKAPVPAQAPAGPAPTGSSGQPLTLRTLSQCRNQTTHASGNGEGPRQPQCQGYPAPEAEGPRAEEGAGSPRPSAKTLGKSAELRSTAISTTSAISAPTVASMSSPSLSASLVGSVSSTPTVCSADDDFDVIIRDLWEKHLKTLPVEDAARKK